MSCGPMRTATIDWLPDYTFYEDGRVFSHRAARLNHGGFLKPRVGRHGYWEVRVWVGRKRHTRTLHSLMAAAFLGPRPDKAEVRHLDGNHLNPRADNLAYGTRKENAEDMVRHGRSQRGEKMHASKLTWDEVREVRRRHQEGEPQPSLASRFGVTSGHISLIVTNQRWKEVA